MCFRMPSVRRTEIGGRYRLAGEEEVVVSFEVASYDRTRPLVIDPVLDFSTYLGASRDDVARGVATDAEGNIYLAGSTGSLDFPLLNPFQEEFGGGGTPDGDVFVTKLDPTASAVLYSTYIGGAGTDSCRGIAVDSQGRAVVGGTTFSGNFPFTPGAFQTVCSGLCPFVVRLSADGSQMSYGTFVGRGRGGPVAVDSLDQVVLTGKTNSNPPDFPVMNAFQPTRGGGSDAFVSKLTSDGSGLVFSTYLGGTDEENLTIGEWDIATDPAGNIYVTGRTRSIDFPVQNAVQGAFGGGTDDAFVTKLTPQGAVVYSTYLGGSDDDQGMGIDADGDGNTYVAGNTLSRDFPTQDPFQANYGGGVGIGDAFVTKIDPAGGALVFSTYLGGEAGDWANDIVVDEMRRAVVVGNGSSNFPVLHPLRDFNAGDDYVTKFAANGLELVYSTPLGARDRDVFVAASGTKILVAGKSRGSLPVLNALQPRSSGADDAFIAQISDAGTLYFAQFGNGPGTVSDLLLTGSEGSASMATVTYRDDDGNPIPLNLVVTGNGGVSVAHTPAGEGNGGSRDTTPGSGSDHNGWSRRFDCRVHNGGLRQSHRRRDPFHAGSLWHGWCAGQSPAEGIHHSGA